MAQIKYRLFSTDKTGRKHLQMKPDPSFNNYIDMQCPFTAPVAVPVQNSLGHSDIRIIGRSCGNDCPLFQISTNNNIHLNCGRFLTVIKPETEQDTKHDKSTLILS